VTARPLRNPGTRPGNRWRQLFESPTAAVLAATVTAWAITPLAAPLDDAYIVVHSGDVLRRGIDAAYGVPALTGITSPAFLAVVVAAHLMATAGLAALRWAIVVGVIAYFLGVWRLAGVAGAAGARRWLVVAAGLAAGTIGINLVNGLETGYACAALVWCFTGILERRPLLAAAAAGIVPALRPDLTPVAAALAVAAAWQEGRRGWRVAALASAVALPFYVWIRVDTGAWWPATMDAKRLFFAEGCLSAEVKAWTALRHLLDWAAVTAPIAAGVLVAMRERLGLIAAAAAAVVIGVYAWSLPGALAHNEMRYLVPLLTPIGLYGFARLVSREGAAAPVAAAFLIAIGAIATPMYVAGRRSDAQELRQIVAWAEANLPGGARVLVHDAGAISTVARIRVVDLVGLKTPASIDAHRRWTWPSCGVERGRAVDEIARATIPDYFIVLDRWDAIFRFTSDLERWGWRLTLVKHPSGLERSYLVYRLALDARGPASNRQQAAEEHEQRRGADDGAGAERARLVLEANHVRAGREVDGAKQRVGPEH
jgi:hypothetical protein